MMRLTWAQPEDLLPHEFAQLRDEGMDAEAWELEWTSAGGSLEPVASGASAEPASAGMRNLARRILSDMELCNSQQFCAEANWEDLHQMIDLSFEPEMISTDKYRRRISGAWEGRAAGCLLGKPVEKIPREGIEEILRSTNRWPLQTWFTAEGLEPDVARKWPWNRRSAPVALEENISGMPEDDDLNYPILGLMMLERLGAGFTTEDVAEAWLSALPAGRVFTAERAAYRNILDARPIPQTAWHLNPFREWIGALIRADIYGWVNPASLFHAVNMAWRDARLSHTRDGIYGAMWAAALTWASLHCANVDEVLDIAICAVPADSRLREAVSFGRKLGTHCDGSEDSVRHALDQLHEKYGRFHWVHVLNNAATIAFALQAGGGDFAKSIALAVIAGWDTDSTAATVGSVVGALNEGQLDRYWTEPLRGKIATSIPIDNVNEGAVAITDLVDRTVKLGEVTL